MKQWWCGSPKVEPFMNDVRSAIARHLPDGAAQVDIYNRAYEAVYAALQSIESPRDWTPCADEMPTNSARYKVTLQVGSEAGTWLETATIPYRYCDGVGEWVLPKSDWLVYGVIAWTKADDPYNPDHIREAGKVEERR